ncbi:MAG: M20/M25/M40 family metallo-hydrolase [Myxococcales bacterium]|nr:M20/M25/M40 family metallo-hydrolase [Myxococcota bacterium]MDW8281840.1 M20/M25/M40 family metallo-hydrolase [Myxococcales bacterium]
MSPEALEQIVLPLRTAAWQAEAEAWLRQLVEISSHSADRIGCQAMAEALVSLYTLPGLSVVRHPDAAGHQGDHLSFATQASAQAPFALLIGHLDTVFPAAVFSGYHPLPDGNGRRARGPGVYDMKGGLVVMAFALRALAQAGLLSQVPLRGVIVSDEEIGSPSGRTTILEVARGAACALGFESGRAGDAIITRRKGIAAYQARATGRSAHAGNAHREGANAIWALARFVDGAQRLTDYDRGITVSVGRIEGGCSRNVVPDRAEALLDVRFVTAADAAAIEAALRQEAIRAAVPGTQVELHGGVTRQPLERTPGSMRLLADYGRCQREAGLGSAEAPLLGGGSDASTVASLGIPAIDGLGPRGSGFHTLAEEVELDTILPKAEALVRFLLTSEMLRAPDSADGGSGRGP